ncbi:MAG: hypothetical protein ACXVIY_01115 [Mucilaginibacter sp.]
MQKIFWFIPAILALFSSCDHKPLKQGSITYNIEYELPDSLKHYSDYLPKTAIVYFKGDSTVSIQQAGEEATTVITDKASGFMRVLLRSSAAKYQVDYKKTEQADVLPPVNYSYAATSESKTIAGHKALKYTLTDKTTGLTSEAWFSKEVSVIPNYLTTVFDTTYGVPLAFGINQNGIATKTTVKEIKFEPVPDGVFAAPAGYKKITPEQFKNLPVGN